MVKLQIVYRSLKLQLPEKIFVLVSILSTSMACCRIYGAVENPRGCFVEAILHFIIPISRMALTPSRPASAPDATKIRLVDDLCIFIISGILKIRIYRHKIENYN